MKYSLMKQLEIALSMSNTQMIPSWKLLKVPGPSPGYLVQILVKVRSLFQLIVPTSKR